MAIDDFFQIYENLGFTFSREILSRFTLSLYTKPFVILSGISGTGKTKIAQLFHVSSLKTHTSSGGILSMTITSGVRDGDGRGNLAWEHRNVVFTEDDLKKIEQGIKDAVDDGNIIEPIRYTVTDQDGKTFDFDIYVQRASSPLLRLRFKSKRGEVPPFDSQPLLKKYQLHDNLYLEKTGERTFKVIGVNDDGKSSGAGPEEVFVEPAKCFVPVRSDWTDPSEVFGYYNALSGQYHLTDVLRFIRQAADNLEQPHFLILDEMNLSKVEHYFSDILSCLESRYLEGGSVKQEEIILHNQGRAITADDGTSDDVPAKISLPLNLYIVGTVNIDESTYMFSPKVLDRANVIEFNEVDLSGGGGGGSKKFNLTSFPSFGEALPIPANAFKSAPSLVNDRLQTLITILKPFNMHFGYRTANEISAFVLAAKNHVGGDNETLITALDIQILQKVLPKLSGGHAKLEEPLRLIISELAREELEVQSITLEMLEQMKLDADNQDFPRSLQKLASMYRSLYTRGFAHFIE